ncbi:hypothetical protein PCIT_a3775 [Pseudoalteromonas citrea]|uniref:Uncharacterized protein n=2 Tax=Pseudoalteromonas citrea TaxID=43655 RepID=A0AAD4FQR8_9GAMM|nr:hypothetical protein [Pseudoalteromonas citrea]KAF7767700.1 hypothetical protein PCIT_a3775 [Pseudoalteromonas citrea]
MFVAHGLWRLYVEAPVIYIGLKGAFNREGIIDLQNNLLATAMKYPPGQLQSAVLDLSMFEMSTADSFEAIRNYFEGVKQRGYVRVDYIGANALARQVLEQLWRGTNTAIYFFDDAADLLVYQPQHHNALLALVQIRFEHPH